MTIVPAIDLIDGKCVRLSKGDYSQCRTYSDSPVDMARRFQDAGLKRLHLVDLDGARSHHIVNLRTLEQIAARTTLTIDFGGGVKSDADISSAFSAGADMVTVGSLAVTDQELMSEWIGKYGPERLILGADVRDGYISVNGWKEDSRLSLNAFIDMYRQQGISHILCTDINRDGMLQGPSVGLYKDLISKFPGIELIASGGVSCDEDLTDLSRAGLFEAIVGKAYYEGRISLDRLSELEQIL